MKERFGWIYLLTCLANGKGYVGQTVRSPEIRWAQHIQATFKGSSQSYLHRAMRRSFRLTGTLGFTAEVIWSGPASKLNAAERRYIRRHRTFVDDDGGWGYNLTRGGGQGGALSLAAKRKVSRAVRAAYKADPTLAIRIGASITAAYQLDSFLGEQMSAACKKSYAEQPGRIVRLSKKLKKIHLLDSSKRAAVGDKMRGRSMSAEACAKIAQSHIGIRPDLATRAKMAESARRRFQDPVQRAWIARLQLGRKQSQETKDKRAAKLRGKVRSAEIGRKISAAKMGKKLSEEHKAALRRGHAKRRERGAA